MNNFLLYKGAKDWVYALSIVATWIWAPALFVSSEIGFKYGLIALLIFTIPNALTLTWFGWVASKVRDKYDGVTMLDALSNASERQKKLHLIISLVLLVCSVCVQLIGIDLVLKGFDIPKWVSALIVCGISLGLVYKHGIKGSIITDDYKYAIAAIAACVLIGYAAINPMSAGMIFEGHTEFSMMDFILSFGLISSLNYFSALFPDQTFWQRAFSMEKKQVLPSFAKASLAFAIIPLLFGTVGMLQPEGTSFNIGEAFSSGVPFAVLLAAASAILISTIDSNLCAIASYTATTKAKEYISPIAAMLLLLAFGACIMIFTNATVASMFLIYGTIRTVSGIPTLLIVFNKFDEKRLFWLTVIGMVLWAPGFVLAQTTGFAPAWIFTILALFTPLLAYKK
jgi:Na+/proline symporter